ARAPHAASRTPGSASPDGPRPYAGAAAYQRLRSPGPGSATRGAGSRPEAIIAAAKRVTDASRSNSGPSCASRIGSAAPAGQSAGDQIVIGIGCRSSRARTTSAVVRPASTGVASHAAGAYPPNPSTDSPPNPFLPPP